MKVVMIQHPHTFKKTDFPPMSIALGFFDGVHLGHQKVIRTAKEIAESHQLTSAVMTFDPHPSVVLSQEGKPVKYITPLDDKIDRISDIGIDYLFIVRFTSAFAGLAPEQFVQQYLLDLNVQYVTAGFDFTYGKCGRGSMDTLAGHGKGKLRVNIIPKLEEGGEKISSTLIRKLLRAGHTGKLPKLLGRYYTTAGTVIHGEKRGRKLGFPTANIQLNGDYIIPKPGVYAVRVLVNGHWENGVCNIGYKPTFHNPEESQLSIEVHLLAFNQSIYGEKVTVEWHGRIRDEQKFGGLDQLKTQIMKDKKTAEDILLADGI